MQITKIYAGLDVGSSTCHAVGLDEAGSVVLNQKFDTSERNLIAMFESLQGEVHVHLESSELAGWVRQVLKPRAKRVVVGHTKTNVWIARDPHKSDRVDAFKLAQLIRMGQLHEVYYDDREDRTAFKQVVKHYDDLTQQEVALKLKIKSRFRVQGVIVRGKAVFTRSGRAKWLGEVKSSEARKTIEQLYSVLDNTLQVQKDAYKLMAEVAKQYPEVERFDKVPGVGPVGACRFSAYVQTPHRFGSKRKFWRYCGLAVTDRSSDGKPLGRRCLDRSGNGRLKDMSCRAFMGAMRGVKDNAIRAAYHRALRKTQDKTHARLTTQRKILTTLLAMWRNGTEYQENMGEVR